MVTAQKTQSSMDEWRDPMQSVHTRARVSAVKRHEALTQATTRINLENTVLSETCQTQRDDYCMTLFT